MMKLNTKAKDALAQFKAVTGSENSTPDQISDAMQAAVTAIAEDAGAKVRAEYEELKNVTDNNVLQARGIQTLTAEETKFYNEVQKNGGFDNDLVWPQTIFERIFEDIQKDHPILRLVKFSPTVGLTKVIRSRRKGVAVFGPLHKDMEGQLDAEFGATEYTQLALTAFFLISKDTLTLGPRWINRYVRLCLSEAVKDIWAQKIIVGTGNNEPIGLLKDLDGAVVGGKYPDKAVAGTLTFKDAATMVTEMAGVLKKVSKFERSIGDDDENPEEKYRKVRGKISLLVNPANYYDIVARVTTQNANGVFVTNLPFISEDKIVESEDVPVDKLIVFVDGEYEATQSQPEKVYEYKETFAMKRAVLYAIDMLGNGQPVDNFAAQVYDINIPAEGETETP
ncbi:phage major capsid protein [Enterococcus dispar]|uniref:HK97 family phage major capsid protein n=1 Tax=Enterococcus dispar ATCC 51266 TaxID=1139219 RepID=S1N909_9ENTE|nr:phage major capsid protein [Enterococcus dispar]EOT43806.1 HK97 family phage major capsid protein [Enterococcus dispar ATCC 51266]EOW85522.1 HK97 family phage major capsid protein [Enterococcus dispar ATCC 51266]OJG37638.1 HK97 family phage major capsid protein [Enterococcus dispar]